MLKALCLENNRPCGFIFGVYGPSELLKTYEQDSDACTSQYCTLVQKRHSGNIEIPQRKRLATNICFLALKILGESLQEETSLLPYCCLIEWVYPRFIWPVMMSHVNLNRPLLSFCNVKINGTVASCRAIFRLLIYQTEHVEPNLHVVCEHQNIFAGSNSKNILYLLRIDLFFVFDQFPLIFRVFCGSSSIRTASPSFIFMASSYHCCFTWGLLTTRGHQICVRCVFH